MIAAGISAAIIGEIAVVLHGHSRTTKNVDLFVDNPLPTVVDVLATIGFSLGPERRKLRGDDIPVHLVTIAQAREAPTSRIEIDGILTVGLPDLIAMKLRSESKNLLRVQDLADVIGRVRSRKLGVGFASQLPKDLRSDYREIAWAMAAGKTLIRDRNSREISMAVELQGFSLDRMVRAVEKVRERLLRSTAALEAAGVLYAVVGDNAVSALGKTCR